MEKWQIVGMWIVSGKLHRPTTGENCYFFSGRQPRNPWHRSCQGWANTVPSCFIFLFVDIDAQRNPASCSLSVQPCLCLWIVTSMHARFLEHSLGMAFRPPLSFPHNPPYAGHENPALAEFRPSRATTSNTIISEVLGGTLVSPRQASELISPLEMSWYPRV